MKVKCAWYDCENYTDIRCWDWLMLVLFTLFVLFTLDFHPWLCPEHRDEHAFDDVEKELRRHGKLV